MTFMGYKRPDGKVGIRNHVLVMPGVVCSTVAAERIVDYVRGSVFLNNSFGCGQGLADTDMTCEFYSSMIANPNIHSCLIVGLGCESIQEEKYMAAIKAKCPEKDVRYIAIQREGGLAKTVKKGIEIVQEMMNNAAKCFREPCDVADLMIGLECGGSDPTSGTSANVVLGYVSDKIVDLGGTTVISETSEAIGAEAICMEKALTPEIGKQICDAIYEKDAYFASIGQDIRDSNPSPGNVRAGLTTLEEKSLGCINKSGTRPFTAYYPYAHVVDKKGSVFMETGAYDAISTPGEIAGGCQMVVFTTGMGNPMGVSTAPVLKITGNHQTAEFLEDLIDFDTSANLRGEKTVQQVGEELFDYVLRVANGERTKAEANGADVCVVDSYHMGA